LILNLLDKKSLKKEMKAIAIINNIDRNIKSEYIDALKSKNADIILWSERNEEKIWKLIA